MTLADLEKRLASLEKTVAELQQQAQARDENPWQSIIGHFVNDPVYDEIVRRGRKYRVSLDRPKKAEE